MRRYPERRILDAYTVEDISTVVKEDSALIIVNRLLNKAEFNDACRLRILILQQVKSNGESLIEQSYKINKECRVTLAEKTFFSRPQTFTYPKHSTIAKEIDYEYITI